MSAIVLTFFFWTSTALKAQTPLNAENFESAILEYNPIQKPGVSDTDFSYGKMILEEMKTAVSRDALNFNRADYFNLLSAFLTLQESDSNIQLAFNKFSDSEGACEYFIAFEEKARQHEKYKPIRDQFLKNTAQCKNGEPAESALSLKDYCHKYQLNQNLVRLMMEINRRDQESRVQGSGISATQARKDDEINQKKIDSLYQVHGCYIGKSLVGPKFETVMWAVIQHSNAEMMRQFLPVFREAYLNNELAVGPLKMTIDRYYAITEGYQIFGSQSGFEATLADERTTNEIKRKFGIQ